MAAQDSLVAKFNGVALRYAASPTALVFKTLLQGEYAGTHSGFVLQADGVNFLQIIYPDSGGVYVRESDVDGLSSGSTSVTPFSPTIRNTSGLNRLDPTASGTSGGYVPTSTSGSTTTAKGSTTLISGLLGNTPTPVNTPPPGTTKGLFGALLGATNQAQPQTLYVPQATAADPNPAAIPVQQAAAGTGDSLGQLLGGAVGWVLGGAGLLIVLLLGTVFALAGRDDD